MSTISYKDYHRFWAKIDGRCVVCWSREAEPRRVRCSQCKERMASQQSSSLVTHRALILDHYGRRCKCCGESEEAFLTIDHVNNDGNTERAEPGKKNPLSRIKKIIQAGFPDSYQILCMNCNFGKRMNGGVCPHKHGASS